MECDVGSDSDSDIVRLPPSGPGEDHRPLRLPNSPRQLATDMLTRQDPDEEEFCPMWLKSYLTDVARKVVAPLGPELL
jgi:hypothetical protein